MPSRNLESLAEAARLLQPVIGELVFVGGCVTALLITDKAAADVRPTLDVDAIAEITSYADYTEFSEKLASLDLPKILARVPRSVAGARPRPSWM